MVFFGKHVYPPGRGLLQRSSRFVQDLELDEACAPYVQYVLGVAADYPNTPCTGVENSSCFYKHIGPMGRKGVIGMLFGLMMKITLRIFWSNLLMTSFPFQLCHKVLQIVAVYQNQVF